MKKRLAITIFLVLVLTLQNGVWDASRDALGVTDGLPYFSGGTAWVANGNDNVVNATDQIQIGIRFQNATNINSNENQPTITVQVSDIVDQNGYTDSVKIENVGYVFGNIWRPEYPGNYTFRSFLVSDISKPQLLSTVTSLQISVKQKVAEYGIGQGDNHLQVDNLTGDSVKVTYYPCNGTQLWGQGIEKIIHIGDIVVGGGVDKYLTAIRADKAVFVYKPGPYFSDNSDSCLI